VDPRVTHSSAVTGGVQLEGGTCCKAGYMGDTIQVYAAFIAASTSGAVDRMRVRGGPICYSEDDLSSSPWEPFSTSKSFPVDVPLNWSGFYVTSQFMDERGGLSPVFCDDISIEGMPPPITPLPTEWLTQISCFSASDVHPSSGEQVAGPRVTFNWPASNSLPEGVFYGLFAYSEADGYAGAAATGMTRENSITLSMRPGATGDVAWYVALVDANNHLLDHGRCSSFLASLLTVDPPEGIKGVHFQYSP
jgi:hypothetical protein